MVHRIDPIANAWAEYNVARKDLESDLPSFTSVIDRHEHLIRLRLDHLERRIQPAMGQRAMIIKVGVAAGAGVLLFPPFQWGARGSSFGLGHSFILTPPQTRYGDFGSIDGIGLIAILAGIALVTWAATLVKWGK